MKRSACYSLANSSAASCGRHFSHAYNASLVISADVGIVTSAFDVLISIISKVIKRIYKSTGYAYASS